MSWGIGTGVFYVLGLEGFGAFVLGGGEPKKGGKQQKEICHRSGPGKCLNLSNCRNLHPERRGGTNAKERQTLMRPKWKYFVC